MSLTAAEQQWFYRVPAYYRALLILLSLGGMLVGCSSSSSNSSQVTDQQPTPPKVTTGSHKVNQGDTLWSIAFRFGWDWKELAQLNGIQPPYVIYPGQVIRFDGNASGGASNLAAAPQPAPMVPVTTSVTSAKPITTASSTKLAPKKLSPTPTPMIASAPVVTPAADAGSANWSWPANGPVLSRFSSNGSLNKGIDIGGQLGQPVLAAAEGTVVYAGSGLRGYGELVIIKHNDTFVSAYGHNQKLLVREGQQVKTGQTIAEMGSTGTDRVKLHFEIRRQGKPIDPLQYLPNR